MLRTVCARAMVAAAVLALATAAVAAPNAAAIMKKAEDAMRSAKTYQGKWLMITSMGDMGTMSMDMNVKSTSSGKMYVATEPAGKPTGMMAMGAQMASSVIVSDGKTVTMYMKGMNSYRKMPQPKGANPFMQNLMGPAGQGAATYKLVGTEAVRGKKCHVIAITPKAAPNQPQVRKMDIKAYIDQQTGRLRQMKTSAQLTGMPGQAPGAKPGQKPKPVTMSSTMLVVSETYNGPIPDSAFKFTPPAGATEMKGGPGGMPGPGGPPRAPGH